MANNNMSYDLQAGDILFEGDVQIVNQIVNQSAQSALGASPVDGGGLEGQGEAQGLANVAVQMQQSGPGASSVDGVRLEARDGVQGVANVVVEQGTAIVETGTIPYHVNVPLVDQFQDPALRVATSEGVGEEEHDEVSLVIDETAGSAVKAVTINTGDITNDPFWIRKFLKVNGILGQQNWVALVSQPC